MTFWNDLKKPFFAMAPMADVTDVAFRALVAARGKPDIFWTEFVSADGLYHTRERQGDSSRSEVSPCLLSRREVSPCLSSNPLMRDLQFAPDQRPIVAQIFSNKPEMIAYATKLVAELGFDGVDINMGCPDRSIEKQGAGAAMIKTPELAVEIIRVAQEASSLPVSVKTRIGYNKEELEVWLPAILSTSPSAITLHLRTRKEMSLVPADWELMKKAVEIRNKINPNVLLIGNGDVQDLEDARAKASEFGCDGIMLGRAMFGNPWVFAGRKPEDTPLAEKLTALIELAHNFEKITPPKNFAILKKHIKAFVTGFAGAAELRAKLMTTNNAKELEELLR
ncbi:MAG: tRNA-dihydrouridine synthase [bacterium]|nr:tRNA-dihydrouridine synthase [bacterium]